MRLNLDIICDHLPKDYHAERFGKEERSVSLGWPLLHEAEAQPQAGKLYVAHVDALPKIPCPGMTAWACVGAQLPREWAASGVQILLITNVSSVLTVYNTIHEIYEKFDAWDCQLRDELEADEDVSLNRMIEIGSLALENHIGVADQFLQVIFSSEIIPTASGEFTVAVSEVPFHAPLSTGESVKNIYDTEGAIMVPFISSLLWRDCRLYCNNLYPLGHYIGSIYVVERHRPFRESDFPLADHFFSYFQRAFLKYLRTSSQVESADITALRSLLDGVALTDEALEQLSLKAGESWSCFMLEEQRGKKYMPQNYMYATIRALMPKAACTVLIYNGAIVGLLRRMGKARTDEGTIGLFREILSRMDYTGGVSNEFTDLHKINDYLAQAKYVVEECVQSGSCQSLQFFCDHVLQYMLQSCAGKLPLESLYSKGLLALLEYDRKRSTDYVKTLDTYLKNKMSVTRTAELLYIHRSSLLKRLEKIHQLIDTDLNDPNVQLYFQLCFRLRENDLHTS